MSQQTKDQIEPFCQTCYVPESNDNNDVYKWHIQIFAFKVLDYLEIWLFLLLL